jgi:O-antigen/teichoic acid export membrane protein
MTNSADGEAKLDSSTDSSDQLDHVVAGAVRGLFGRDSVYMIMWAVQLVAAASLTPLLTRTLSASDFGIVVAATAVMEVIFVIAGFGLYSAIQRQYAMGAAGREPAQLLMVSCLAAIVLTAVADITGPYWAAHVGFGSYNGPVRIAVLWAGTSAVTYSALGLLRSQDRLLPFSIVSLLQSVVAQGTSLLLVKEIHATATVFLLGQLSVQIAAAGLALSLAPPRFFRLHDFAMVRRALAFGLPLIPAILCTVVLESADRLILKSQMGPVSVARYQVAYNVGALPMLMLGVLNTSWMPRIFALKAAHERAAVIGASRDLLYILLVPVLIGSAIGAPIILRLWAPSAYDPDGLLLVNAIVLISAIPYTAQLSSSRVLMAEGRTGFIAVAQICTAATNVALNFVLIPYYGLTGSALATLLALGLLHILMRWRARALAPIQPTGIGLVLAVAVTASLVLAFTALPTTGMAAVGRLALAALTVVWFAYTFVTRVQRHEPVKVR